MTVAPVPPALGALAAIRPEATLVVPSPGASAAGLAQRGTTTQLTALETTPPASPLPQIATTAALDALALNAAAQAAKGEGGLALLLADLSQALRIPGLPAPVQAAIGQILALQAPLNAPPTGADLKAALTQSSPPRAAQPAIASALPGEPLAAAVLSSGGPLKIALLGLQQVLKTWLATAPALPASPGALVTTPADAAPRQASPAPVLADLVESLRASGLPVPVQSALLQSLAALPAASPAAMPTPLNLPPAPVQASIAGPTAPAAPAPISAETASLPTELALALPATAGEQALPPSPAGAPAAAALAASGASTTAADPAIAWPPEIKAALSLLQQSALAPAEAAPSTATASGPGPILATPITATVASALAASVLSAVPAGADLQNVMLFVQQVLKNWLDGASAQPSSAATATGLAQEAPAIAAPPGNAPNATNSPPPPYRGGPTTAQPAVPSTLPLNADPVTVGNRLIRETSAALAHQELLQIASIPTATQGPARSDGQNPQWMFEIPFATAQGSAVAQFKIARDGGKGSTKRGQAPVWRAHFSLNVEPMGPVHAQIVLSGDRTWVSLWAEREESVTRLREHEALLSTSLKDSNFVAEVAFHAGAPRQPATAGRHFLDHES